MSASQLLAQPGIDLSGEDQEAQEQLRLLEIMKTAPPAPNPPPAVIFSDQESLAPEFRGIVVYDPVTGEEIVVPAPDAGILGPVEPTPPYGGVNPFAVPMETPEGEDSSDEPYPLIVPTPPTPINNATTFPWNTIHKILMRFNVSGIDYYYVCSAWAADEFMVITAGHCVYNWDPNDDGNTSDRRWANEIWVWAGQGDVVIPLATPDRPYGEAKGVLFRSYTGWTNNQDLNHDMGFITLNRRDGVHTGWMGRESSVASSLNFSGYPVETPYVPAGTLVQYYGYDANNVSGSTDFRISLDAFIYGGHSGGPSWRLVSGNRYVEGIHSTSNRVGAATDTRITAQRMTDIDTLTSDDELNRPPTARPDLIEYFLDGNNRKDLLTNSTPQGGTIQVEYNALNSGFATSNNFTVSFYLSTNTIITTGDTLIGTRTHTLNSWTLTNPTATLTVPESVAPGNYYVGWIMSGGELEYTTSNNTVVIDDETVNVTPIVRTITVTQPNGGESWQVGTTNNIMWTSSNAGANVKIELFKGGVFNSTIVASTANDGSHLWTIPSLTEANDYKVKITSISYPTVSDLSNGNFTITAPIVYDYTLTDTNGLVWKLNRIGNNPSGMYFEGIVDMGYEIRNAVATYLKSDNGLSMSGDEGSGVAFNYEIDWTAGKSGSWINVNPSAGHGLVTVSLSLTSEVSASPGAGPGPGREEEGGSVSVPPAAPATLTDSFGYIWTLTRIDSDATAQYYSGTVTLPTGVRDAVAIFLKSNKAVSMTGARGTGVPFNENYKWTGGGGSGVWININPSPGYGLVTVTLN